MMTVMNDVNANGDDISMTMMMMTLFVGKPRSGHLLAGSDGDDGDNNDNGDDIMMTVMNDFNANGDNGDTEDVYFRLGSYFT